MKLPAIEPSSRSVGELLGLPLVADPRIARGRIALVSDTEVRAVLVDEYRERTGHRLERELQRGRPRAVNCFSCGRFKPRPSSVCDYCGDDPVTHNGDRAAFDEAYYGERPRP